MKEVKEIPAGTFSRKDDSVRGFSTVTASELRVGDKIVLSNHFTEIVE